VAAAGDDGAPEIGQLVEVRGRPMVVTDSIASALPPDVLAGETERQHLLTLSSVEDDALGDELRVIWEAEVGRRKREEATLPEVAAGAFDDPAVLSAFLDAVRWGAVTSADRNTLQAPFRSGITIEDYQLEPLVRALGQPRVNLLIADDVGLGKTIEAGLVVQELLLRHRIRRVMVVCPATLTLKWKAEMAEKFGLDFTIVDSECLKQLRRTQGIGANPFRVYPLTIVSLQWLPGARAERILNEVLPAMPGYPRTFDLLIVDEAHHVAPKAPKAMYAVDSQQTRAMRRLAQHFEHRLFLSATPHNGYRESWTALLAMLDPLRFARGVEPDEEARRDVVIRRMKDSIRKADGSPRFPAREVRALEVEYSDADREAHRLLQAFSESRRRRAEQGGRARSAVDIATLLLKKRLFSSPIAFARTIEHYAGTLQRKSREEQPAEKVTPAAIPSWLEQMEIAGQEEADDEAKTEAEHDQLTRVSSLQTVLTPEENGLLADMVTWARAEGDRPDAKARELMSLVEATCRPDGAWNDERIVVFTEYRDTQRWLADLLEARELGGERVRLLYGGQDEDEREGIKNSFQAPPDRDPVRILLATDCAGEGIDLQLHCHRVVNYDIPFNPNRLEQRIGRIDRHGQREAPLAFHFVGAGWEASAKGSYERDLEFLARVARKVAAQGEDLGEINAVLEKAIQEHMVGAARPVDPSSVKGSRAAKALKAERQLRERVDQLGARVRESIDELRLSPRNLERVTQTALRLARQPALEPSGSAGNGLFKLPPLSGGWARALAGIEDPLTRAPRPLSFDASAAESQEVVLGHLGHPLVAMATRLLRAAVWGTGRGSLNRVAVCIGTGLELEATLAVAFSRLVLVGADGVRLHEEVFAAGGWLRDGRFMALGVMELGKLVEQTLSIEEPERSTPAEETRLAAEWQKAKPAVAAAIANRAREREGSVNGRLESAKAEDLRRLANAVAEFRKSLERALRDPETEQLELRLGGEERTQLRRDVEGWQATLAGLDSQVASESEQVERRYSKVRALTFPAAVLFVTPDPSR
jgi:superfamily II DNA or RNA helicase